MTAATDKSGREDRLAAKLRENLRRRKAQGRDMARQMGETAEDSPTEDWPGDALPKPPVGG